MIVDFLELLAIFLLSFFWSPPNPIKIVIWAILAIALILLIVPIGRVHPFY